MSMQIFVTTPIGATTVLDVESSDSIEAIWQKLEDKGTTTCWPIPLRTLTFGGQTLEDGHTLADYNIPKESTLELEISTGVVDYCAISPPLAVPPDGGDQFAFLAEGSIVSQTIGGIVGGAPYRFGCWLRGSLHYRFVFIDGGGNLCGEIAGDLDGSGSELSARGVDVTAATGAVSVTLYLNAVGDLSLLDLVSLVQTGEPPAGSSSVGSTTSGSAPTPLVVAPNLTG